MYKIGIIGDINGILPFKAIGISIFPVADYREAHKTVLKLAKENYAIIFLTERLSVEMSETLNMFKNEIVPAIILVPDQSGSMGIGMAELVHNVEKAIGANIFLEKEGQ